MKTGSNCQFWSLFMKSHIAIDYLIPFYKVSLLWWSSPSIVTKFFWFLVSIISFVMNQWLLFFDLHLPTSKIENFTCFTYQMKLWRQHHYKENMSYQVWGLITDLRLTFIDLWWPKNLIAKNIGMLHIKWKDSSITKKIGFSKSKKGDSKIWRVLGICQELISNIKK